jgi:hypothetical protein
VNLVSEDEPKSITMKICAEKHSKFLKLRFLITSVSLILKITYVDKYPDEVPQFELSDCEGLSESEFADLTAKITSLVSHYIAVVISYQAIF